MFIEKYGDFNVIHFKNILENDNNSILENILSGWFMWEKKLIIIDDIPIGSKNKNTKLKEKQSFLETILERIPENNIVLFSSVWVDKRGTFYKKLKKINAKIEEFNSDDSSIYNTISNKYNKKISAWGINLLIRYKWWDLWKINSEIEKLLINYDYIEEKNISDNIMPELEENIFIFIDDLLNLNIKKAIEKMEIILSQTSTYWFYNNLLANLRTQVFIKKLQKNKKSYNEINEILDLKNRSFLINKNYQIDQKILENLFINLINLDKKMKSWKMIWSEEEVLKYEIEKEFLKLVN